VNWTNTTAGAAIVAFGGLGVGIGYVVGQPPGPPTVETVSKAAAPTATDPAAIPAPAPTERTEARPSADGDLDLAALPTTDWLSMYDPDRAWAGYTLLFYERRVPMLVDMNGRVVHGWPDVRAVGRARLTPEGNLLYIGVDDSLVEVDWDGQPVRSFNTGNSRYFPHHDLQWAPNNQLLGIFRAPGEPTDNILVIDENSELVWTWASGDHLGDDLLGDAFKDNDLTHFNSVQSIPDNPRARSGDTRFNAGNILVSSRHLSTVYLVDRNTGDVAWKHTKGLDWQHEAILLGDDVPGAGNVLLFNNRYHSDNRQSEVLEIDPSTNEVVWRYTDERFFSDTAGTAQKLPNGNVVITSSRGGRIFEVTTAGEIVWQWTPPYHPMRSQRYAADFCPQLAALPPMQTEAVPNRQPKPYIDEALYDFALSKEVMKAKIGGKKRRLLAKPNNCHDLMLPGKAMLVFEYGFAAATDESDEFEPNGNVMVTLARPGEAPETIFEKSVSLETDGEWSRERLRLDSSWNYVEAEMCIRSSGADRTQETRDQPGFAVGAPKVISGYRPGRRDLPRVTGNRTKKSKATERTLQQRQLEALGYME